MIKVNFQNRIYSVPEGSRVSEIIGRTFLEDHKILGATLNNHLVSLETSVDADCELGVVTAQDREGAGILRRTSAHCLHHLFARDFPDWGFRVGQSLMGGYFYEAFPPDSEHPDLEAVAGRLNAGLVALAAARLPLQRERVSMEAASVMLTDPFGHKARLLAAWTGASVPLIRLEDFVDIQHGPYACDTSCVTARVVAYPPGLVLQFEPQPMNGRRLYTTYREARDWNELVGIATVGDLNCAVLQDRIADVISVAEALHEKRIAAIADEITRQRPRLVVVAGPSSSGKTTFIKRLGVQLRVNGQEPLCVSLDDYYRPHAERLALGQSDLEAFEALDLELWGTQVRELLAGRPVHLPRYIFARGLRADPQALPVALRDDQLLLVEGIHGLNPRLVEGQPAFRIFISALTQLVIDEHNRIFTSDARLLRRLVRDRRYRGVSAAITLERWASVRQGEDRNIFPYQETADAIFNSALVYEAAVLRPLAWRYLLEVPRTHPSRVRAYSLLKFLELFVPVFPDSVPSNSILREFLGGGSFQY